MNKEAMRLALEALENINSADNNQDFLSPKERLDLCNAVIALWKALAEQPAQQEPVEVDQATMKLAESVGLIGPTSRTHDLHQAIQRFHDLICVNATVKAAQMAADVIRECTQPQRKPLPKGEWPKHPSPYVNDQYRGYLKSDLDDYAMQVLTAHGIKGEA